MVSYTTCTVLYIILSAVGGCYGGRCEDLAAIAKCKKRVFSTEHWCNQLHFDRAIVICMREAMDRKRAQSVAHAGHMGAHGASGGVWEWWLAF